MIRRFWVLYCFANKTTEQRLAELIESKKEKYHIVPLSSSSNASAVIKETLNNDRARNIGLKKSLEEGAEWALNLDGAQIMSQEGIQSLDKALKRAEENSQRKILKSMTKIESMVTKKNFSFYKKLSSICQPNK